MDADVAGLFEAHVRYEVGRWRGEALGDAVTEHVEAAFDWLDGVGLRELVPEELARAWVRHAVAEAPVTDELVEEVAWALRAVHEALLQEAGPLSDVLPADRYRQAVSSVVGLRGLRREVIAQATSSGVYQQLISHVLYHGLKTYLLTENAVLRRVPGASSLLRMGQNAVRSASPNLEAGIDRTLLAFVASNVAETARDSREFLEVTLDDAMLGELAEEIWATNGRRPVAELAALLEEGGTDHLVATARDVWLAARRSPLATRLVDALVEQFYGAHGDEPLAAVLADLGLTRERTADAVTAVAAPLAEAALDGGQLEAFVRRRLEGFYAGCTGPVPRVT